MLTLQRQLGRMFTPSAPRKPADPAYAAFRTYCKRVGVTYKIARDGYIEFSDGVMFGHYGDWAETMDGHQLAIGERYQASLDALLEPVIKDALAAAESSLLPMTVYRDADGWHFTNTVSPRLNGAKKLHASYLPSGYFVGYWAY